MSGCSVNGCADGVHARGYCKAHYLRVWRTGSIESTYQRHGPGAVCDVETCSEPVKARGWCGAHYARWKKTGDPVRPTGFSRKKSPTQYEGLSCSESGCDRPARFRGMCPKHYQWHQRNPDGPIAAKSCTVCGAMFRPIRGDRQITCSKPCYKEAACRRTRAWRDEHPDLKTWLASQYARHREANQQRGREYYAAHREQGRVNARAWVEANREKRREIQRRYKRSENGRQRDLASVHNRNARIRNAPGVASVEQMRARWDYYGGRCWMCGRLADEWDHVIPVARGGSNWPANLRPACRQCNVRKGARDFVKSAP